MCGGKDSIGIFKTGNKLAKKTRPTLIWVPPGFEKDAERILDSEYPVKEPILEYPWWHTIELANGDSGVPTFHEMDLNMSKTLGIWTITGDNLIELECAREQLWAESNNLA